MRIEVAVMMQVNVPDNTNLDDLDIKIDGESICFTSQGRVVADASHIEDYYIDDIESGKDNWDEEDDWDEEDEEEQ